MFIVLLLRRELLARVQCLAIEIGPQEQL